MKRIAVLCGIAALSSTNTFAATGKPDLGQYVGSDSLNPAPKLPAAFTNITDVSSGFTHTAVTMTLPGDGDDALYNISLPGTSLYGSPLTSCRVSMNGYVVCGGNVSLYDNRALPDGRFGGATVIAPYWDDLAPIAGTSAIDVYTSGSAVIVQWTKFMIISKPMSRLTFRAIFQAGAAGNRGSVVFQYLEMTNGADGSGATIGIERDFRFNQYAFNTTGSVTMGALGANALQAVLFGYDTDGDRLSDTFETTVGSDPALVDTDGGGLHDGAELAAGKDPTVMGDDGANTDTDGDTISDASEMFYGTSPTKKDTDADGTMGTNLDDNVELFTSRTDPTRTDTDLDGFADGYEIDNATNPLDPTDQPGLAAPLNLTSTGGTTNGKYGIRSAVDANGKIHVVAVRSDNGGIIYWMVDPAAAGTVMIPETLIKAPDVATSFNDTHMRSPTIRVFNGKVYITWELFDHAGGTNAGIAFVRLNPANAPQNGTGVLGFSLVEAEAFFKPTAGAPRNHDMVVDGNGVHLSYVLNPSFRDRTTTRLGVGYARLSNDGAAQLQLTMPLPQKGGNGGTHKRTETSLAVAADGTVHLVYNGTNKKGVSSSLIYAQIKSGTATTYDIPLPFLLNFVAVSLQGNTLHVFGSGGFNGQNAGSTYLAIDTASISSSPALNDFWMTKNQIDASSLRIAPVIMSNGGDRNGNQASIVRLSNGGVVGYFSHGRNGSFGHDICLSGFLADGTPMHPLCVEGGNNGDGKNQNRHGHRRLDLTETGGSLVFFYNQGSSSDVFMSKLDLAGFGFPATMPTLNTPPHITSTPPSGNIHVTQAYSYTGMATDVETPNMLTWSLASGPAGMTVTAAGVLSWTPTTAQVGDTTAVIQVCDGGSPKRCAGQLISFSVAAPGAPIITSTPPTSAPVGQPYAYQLVAQDPQNNITAYAITAPATAPGNMAISSSGLLTWTPTNQDVGTVMVTLTVTDGEGLSASQSFPLVVTVGMSIDPVFTSIPSTAAVVGQPYGYVATAVDPGDANATFTYTLVSTPTGNMAVTSAGAMTWTPGGSEKGTQAVTIKATSSSGRSAQQSFVVTVIQAGGCSCDLSGHGRFDGWMLVVVGLAIALLRRRNRSA